MNYHEDDRAQRIFDVFPQVNGQINISYVRTAQHVVAWHRHKKQTDYWFCPKGSFKVGLGRPREDGGVDVFWYYLSDKNFHVLQIPPGIWHGYKALEMNSIMLYYLSEKYDENDEEKVLPGHFGEDWRTISK